MPKKIPDVKNKILHSAEQLFNQYPYEEVDIRQIASNAGVAVGTIYYHFTDKSQLFIASFWESLKEVFEELDQIIKSDQNPEKKFRIYLYAIDNAAHLRIESIKRILLEGIRDYASYGDNSTMGNLINDIKNRLISGLEYIVLDMVNNELKINEKFISKIAVAALAAYTKLDEQFPDEVEQNIEFSLLAVRSIIEAHNLEGENCSITTYTG